MIILNNHVNTGQRMKQENNTQILMKDNEQKTVHSFFYKNNFKQTMRFPGKQEQEQLKLKSIQKTFYLSLENKVRCNFNN